MLSGRTVLIVEAQYLIALDLQHNLDCLHPEAVLITHNAAQAREVEADWSDCGLAIVEVERELPDQIAFVGELLRRGIPVIAISADSQLTRSVNWFASTPVLFKPVPAENLCAAVESLLKSQNV